MDSKIQLLDNINVNVNNTNVDVNNTNIDVNNTKINLLNDEYEIIVQLISDGPVVFEELFQLANNDLTKQEYVVKYIMLYLTDTEVFPNGIDAFINYMIHNEENIWAIYCKIAKTSDILKVTKLLLHSYKKRNACHQIILCHQVLNDSNLHVFNNITFWSQSIILDTFMFLAFDEEWDANIDALQRIISYIVQDKKNKDNFVTWCAGVLNNNLNKMNLTPENHSQIIDSDFMLANIYTVLLYIYQNETQKESFDVSLQVDYNYIISKKCQIRWYDRTLNTDDSQFTFTTKCFFLILNAIRIIYVPIITRAIEWPDILKSMIEKVDSLTNSGSMFASMLLRETQKQIIFTQEYVNNDMIINNKFNNHITLLHNFYKTFIIWISKSINNSTNTNINMDDALSNMIYIFNHQTVKDVDENTTCEINNVINFGLNILNSNKKYTSNLQIKLDIMRLFTTHAKEFTDIVFDRNELMSELIYSLICISNNINDSTMMLLEKYTAKYKINGYLDKFINISSPIMPVEILSKKIYGDIFILQKMLNNNNIDIQSIVDISKNIFTKCDMKKLQNLNEGSEEYEYIMDNLTSVRNLFDIMYGCINTVDLILHIVIPNTNIYSIIDSKPILKTIIVTISMVMDLINYIHFDIEIIDVLTGLLGDITMDAFIDKLFNVITLLTTIVKYQKLGSLMNELKFDMDNYKSTIKHFPDKTQDNIIDQLERSFKEYKTITAIIPDEFIDPISCDIIDDPVLLPNMVGFDSGDLFIDKSIIMKQLLSKEENPFNRQKLTMNELNEFNKRPEILEKIMILKNKIDKWKNENDV